MMADTKEPVDGPPHYPHGGTYADLLCWHMDYWGTRPTGSVVVNGLPWEEKAFRQEAFGSGWEERTYYNGMRNWRGKGSAPESVTAELIEKALFGTEGDNHSFDAWRNDLRHFYKNSHRTGKNVRTRWFPDPPPPGAVIVAAPANIPRLNDYFVERNDELIAVLALFPPASESATILIQGGLGVGKTELTKAVARHPDIVKRFGGRRWFVPLETVTDAAKLESAIITAFGCDPKLGFEPILNNLRGKQALLVLDGLENPMDPIAQRYASQKILAELSAVPGLTILASARGREKFEPPRWTKAYEICELDAENSVNLFVKITGEWARSDKNLMNIVEDMDGLPLALNLVASRGFGRNGLTDLWRRWQEIGPYLAIRQGNGSQRVNSLVNSIEFSLRSERMTDDAMRLLRILGQSPAGLSPEMIRNFIGDSSFDAIEALENIGITNNISGYICISSPIREYIRRTYKAYEVDLHQIRGFYKDIINNSDQREVNSNFIMSKRFQINAEQFVYESIDFMEGREAISLAENFFCNIALYNLGERVLEKFRGTFQANKDFANECLCLLSWSKIVELCGEIENSYQFILDASRIYKNIGDTKECAKCINSAGLKSYWHARSLFLHNEFQYKGWIRRSDFGM